MHKVNVCGPQFNVRIRIEQGYFKKKFGAGRAFLIFDLEIDVVEPYLSLVLF